MQVRSIKGYRSPGYPDRIQMVRYGNSLGKYLPETWKYHSVIPFLLTAYLTFGPTTGSSRATAKTIPQKTSPVKGIASGKSNKTSKTTSSPKPLTETSFAPAFLHGEGKGAMGCVVMSPAVFLPENDAWDVISTRFSSYGLTLERKRESLEWPMGQSTTKPLVSRPAKFTVDGFIKELNLGVQYMDEWEAASLLSAVNNQDGLISSVWSFDYPKTIEALHKDLKTKNHKLPYNVVSFYDPSTTASDFHVWSKPEELAELRNGSKKMLESQVDDFIAWFVKQGYPVKLKQPVKRKG
mgnify:CR=1 FL=1